MHSINKKLTMITVVLVDIRSAHNVGAILRSCDGFGASACLVGVTPRPYHAGDDRLPHIARKNHDAVVKTALGAEQSVDISYFLNFDDCVATLKNDGWKIVGLEQSSESKSLKNMRMSEKTAVVVGREVEGLSTHEMKQCDELFEIPMVGSKESFNVAVAASIALYHMRVVSLN